jgi:hypothetical protein
MRIRTLALPPLALFALAATRPEPRAGRAPQASTPITVALTVGGKAYNAKGKGECTFAPVASIYGVRAQQWGVRLSGGGELSSVGLTVWRPSAGGGDQLNLYVSVGSKSHRIDTVKGSQKVGSGTVTVQPKGMGGRFTIDGKDAAGAAIRGTIECGRFAAPNPVAG